MEGVLDAVAVMGIQIHIGDSLQALVQHRQDAQDGVVEKTETAGPVAPSVMGAAGRAVNHAACAKSPAA